MASLTTCDGNGPVPVGHCSLLLTPHSGTDALMSHCRRMTQEKPPAPSPTDRIRQGVISGRVVTVLAVSLVLTVIGFVLSYLFF